MLAVLLFPYYFQGDDGLPGPVGPKGIRVSDTALRYNVWHARFMVSRGREFTES